MKLRVNGEPREFPENLTVTEMLEALGVKARRVAVEVNRTIVPRSEHVSFRLSEGDQLEIVTFVQGG